jgi:hypothetical protein
MASNSRQRSRDEVDESHRNGFVSGWFLWLLGMYLSFLVEEHAISSPWTDWVEISQVFLVFFLGAGFQEYSPYSRRRRRRR